ncbi:MAG: iron-sulfur cluster assembly protein [bacterium]
MQPDMREQVVFTENCQAVEIPEGHDTVVKAGTEGFLVQARGGSLTIRIPESLKQVQIDGRDLEVLETPAGEVPDVDVEEVQGVQFDGVPDDMEQAVYDKLGECYDPEIPVNIVDLGLVYAVNVNETGDDFYQVDVKMTLTAQGCGMGGHISGEAQRKVASIPGVEEADVEIVWDPQWTEDMMSDDARQKLGLAG